ncbi:MAG: radical SAM protein [Phycisphaerae bacterium]
MDDDDIERYRDISLPQHARHPRDWRQNLYVYPVMSRRSGGLSIGVNLNPDTACNFDCVYCQVDRSVRPRVRDVDVAVVRAELAAMVDHARTGTLFEDPAFACVPAPLRRINDIAFSGDGEPTTCRHLLACVQAAADVKRDAGLDDVKIVLITDACYLTKPDVADALGVLDEHNGAIWAKLDAGTEGYYRRVNRPNVPLQHVVDNIIAAARVRPVVIQSLFMRLDGVGPGDDELAAYTDRLSEITRAGGRIDHVQVYTVARPPAEGFVTALTRGEVDQIVALVATRAGLRAEAYYAPAGADAAGSTGGARARR